MIRARSSTLLLFSLWLAAFGCASLPLIGTFVSVNVPSELPLPDSMTLDLGPLGGSALGAGNQLLSALGGGSIQERLGQGLKPLAGPLRVAGAEAFKKQLEDAKIFGSVVHQGGNLGLSLGVSRWGLAYNPSWKRLMPVLDIEATLSAPGLGVVWKASRSVADLGAEALKQVSGLSPALLLAKPQSLNDAMGVVTAELSRQLVDDLKKNPPHAP